MRSSEYELLAHTVDWYWWHRAKRQLIQIMLSKHKGIAVAKNKFVLDFGCGVGSNFPVLAQYGKVIGVDVSKQALAYAKQQDYFALYLTRRFKFPNLHTQFGLVACFDVLYHQHVNDLATLSWLASVTKKQGMLIVTDCVHPALWSKHDETNMARERYSADELLAKVNQSGWQVVDWSYGFMSTFPLFFISRFFDRWFGGASSQHEHSIPRWLNNLFIGLTKLDQVLLKFWRLPFGSSIIILALKR